MRRIAFVTGCLEPGRDGVGDYTRDLAAECVRAGHDCLLVALNDPHASGERDERSQSARGVTLPALRLHAAQPWDARFAAAARSLDAAAADDVSYQFVPYALHPKGIVTGLEAPLAKLARGRETHLMCHELWVGAERGATLRHRLVGRLQRAAVLRLVRELAPRVVHTSNAAYRELLALAGVPARVLPLCGSVPVAEPPPAEWLAQELLARGVPAEFTGSGEPVWRLGVFGSIHPGWAPEPLLDAVVAEARRAGRRVLLVSIGRQGHGAETWTRLGRRRSAGFATCTLGERNGRELSWFLQSIDVGVATTPWALIGKSATVAAMLDHGLPVVVPRDDVNFGFKLPPPDDALLHRYEPDFARRMASGLLRREPVDGAALLAARFLVDLHADMDVEAAAGG